MSCRLIAGFVFCLPFLAPAQTINPGGVVNAANYGPTVAPGGIMSIFGTGLGQLQYLQTLPYPYVMGVTSVTVNGERAPLLFVSQEVVNALVPADVPANTTARVVVTVNNSPSQSANVAIGAVSPAPFTSDGTGKHHVAAQHLDYSPVNGAAPAQPGEEIAVYVNGMGTAAETPNVTVGGQAAQVIYSGETIYPGLYQINLKIPNVVAGDHEIVIRMPSENISSSAGATVPVAGPVEPHPITPELFGLHVSPGALADTVSWPTFQFGPVRMHDDAVGWDKLANADCTYHFTQLDKILAEAAAKGKTELIYTMARTPPCASSDPNNSCGNGVPGTCAPPNDLNADGTGGNHYWIDFVTAIANHAAGEIPGRIRNWEIWNEPNAANFWTGTNAQLIRMAKDAYTIIKRIDPQAVILTPAPANAGDGGPSGGAAWLSRYLIKDGGAQWADVIAFHGYLNPQTQSFPEDVLQGLRAIVNNNSAGMPLWNTEGGWGRDANLRDPDLRAAFVARSYLLHAGTAARYYWYAYDNGAWGTLFTDRLTGAGVAYGQVFNWLAGAAVSQPCAALPGSTVWTCQFARQDGYLALAVWDTSQTCSSGVCTTSGYAPPSSAVAYSDLAGNTTPIPPGSVVPIGAKPVLVTNK